MKTHTSGFKTNIAKIGRDLDSKITYELDGETIELGAEQLNSVTPHYKADILKSVMKQLDIDSNVDIPIGTVVNYQFGVKVNDAYEYLDYGNYIVNKSERQEDLYSYKITCYDKMLLSMVDYEDLEITYPITIRNYINAICTKLGITFANANDTFVNYDKEIDSEKYLDESGNSLGYKFRDVLDELAQVTASTICINNDDELEIRYVQEEEHEIKTATGTNIEITDAYNVPVNEDKMSKLSTQKTTTGKNKFNGNNPSSTSSATYNFQDSILTISSTATNTLPLVVWEYDVNENETWRLNGIIKSLKGQIVIQYYTSNWNTIFSQTRQYVDGTTISSISYTISSGVSKIRFLFYSDYEIPSGASSSSYENIIITKDNSDMSYEEYSGKNPSPNPDYPQEVKTVKGYRNLFNESQLLDVDGWTLDSNNYYNGNAQNLKNTYGISTDGFSFDTSFKANTQYTIILTCYNSVNKGNARIDVLYTDETSEYSTPMNNTTAEDFIFTTASGKTVQSIRFNCNANAVNIYIKNMQIIEGTLKLPYVPYGTNWVYKKIIGKNLFNYLSTDYIENATNTLTGTGNDFTISGSANSVRAYNLGLIDYNTLYRYMSNNYVYLSITLYVTPSSTYNSWNAYSSARTLLSNDWSSSSFNLSNYQNQYLWVQLRGGSTGGSYTSVNYKDFILAKEEVTTYKPYQESIITIPLNNNEIAGIGDYKDELIIDNNGHCWLNKKIGKMIFDGTETWSTDGDFFYTTAYGKIGSSAQFLCNYAIYKNKQPSTALTDFYLTASGAYYPEFSKYNFTDTSAFKTWLSTNNIIVYYPLTTSELIDLNYDVDLTLFEGTNYISHSEDMDMEIKYYTPTITNDVIDEDFFKDVNVDFGKKYGPINSVVLSRSAAADNIYEQDESSVLTNGLCELKISDNQIMNGNDRDTYLQEIFEKLNGLEYYINDYVSTGIMYYDLCDRYFAHIGDNDYSCVMLNDEALVTQGLQENIHTDMPVVSVTEYDKADKTDRKINQTYLIVDKQNGEIQGLVSKTNAMDTTINNNYQEITQKFNGYTPTSRTVEIENSVRTLQTDTYTKTEINTKLVDGSVQKVQTVSGTFDENGMTYEKTNAPTKTTINEVGVNVKDESNRSILFSGYVNENNTEYADYKGQTIVASENIIVRHYFVMPDAHSRIEKYGNGGGMFYV